MVEQAALSILIETALAIQMDAADALAIVVGVGIIVIAGLAGFGYFLRKKSGA
jgi:hypothetical protein